MSKQLQAIVDSLDNVDEALKPYYTEKDGKHVLSVAGVSGHPEVAGLKSAFEKEKRDRIKLKETLATFGEHTPDSIKALKEKADSKATQEAQAVRTEYEGKLAKADEKVASMRTTLHSHLVDGQIATALAKHKVKSEFVPAVTALLRGKNPTVAEDDNGMRGMFPEGPSGLPGSVSIDDYIEGWAKLPESAAFLDATNKGGSGAGAETPPNNTPPGGSGDMFGVKVPSSSEGLIHVS